MTTLAPTASVVGRVTSIFKMARVSKKKCRMLNITTLSILKFYANDLMNIEQNYIRMVEVYVSLVWPYL